MNPYLAALIVHSRSRIEHEPQPQPSRVGGALYASPSDYRAASEFATGGAKFRAIPSHNR
jgi:hypothetical protein